MEELKPCPFCGGEAKLCDPAIDGFYIECINTKCLVTPQTWCYDDKEAAIEAWNTRYEPSCTMDQHPDYEGVSDKRMTEQSYCPIRDKECRKDCTWYHEFITISEEGMQTDSYCAISVIANRLCDIAKYGEVIEE